MSSERYVDNIYFLSRSHNRVQLLLLLNTHKQLDKDYLKERCSADRTTLQRNLDGLEKQGWVENTEPREYRITLCGEMIAEAFVTLIDTVETADELDEFLRWVPSESFDLDPRTLAGAQITVADRHDPYAAVNKHVEALKTTEEFRGLFGVVGRGGLEVQRQMLLNDEARDELVVSAGAAEVLQSGSSYAPLISELLESGNLRVFIYDGSILYHLGIYDDVVQIGVEDDNGMPRAMIETESKGVREWAEQKYEYYREQSRELD